LTHLLFKKHRYCNSFNIHVALVIRSYASDTERSRPSRNWSQKVRPYIANIARITLVTSTKTDNI